MATAAAQGNQPGVVKRMFMRWRTSAPPMAMTNRMIQPSLFPYVLGKWLLTIMKSNGKVM